MEETAQRKGTHDTRFSASTRVLEQLKAGECVCVCMYVCMSVCARTHVHACARVCVCFVVLVPHYLVDSLNSGVESLFNKAGCDSTAITELLGGHAGVTDSNILQYMGIIEQRCNELLHLQSFIQAKVTLWGHHMQYIIILL